PLPIVSLITVREINHLFRIELVVRLRYDASIGNDVIDVVCTHRARITQIIDLNWRAPLRKDAGTESFGKTHQIDCYVDLQASDAFGDLSIRLCSHIEKMSE